MNDTVSPPSDADEFGPSAQYVASLPEVKLHSRIDGPCFVLEVEGRKAEGRLSIDRMRVVGSSVDGVARAAYTFEGRLDPLGVVQLSPLLTHRTATRDVQFLAGVLQATECFSASDWKAAELQAASPAGIRSVIPSFEEFCADPGLLSRNFFSERFVEGGSCERLEAQISGAGEFVEVRLLAESHRGGGAWLLKDYFKALLPSNPGRSVSAVYDQVRQLLESATGEWLRRGRDGIEAYFLAQKCDVICRRRQGGDPLSESDVGGAALVQDCGETIIPSARLRLRYQIAPGWARVSVESGSGIGSSSAEITFNCDKRSKALSASQVRCVVGLLRCVVQQRWAPQNEFEAFMLGRLQGNSTRSATHAPGSMQALEISIVGLMADATRFFSEKGCQLLADEGRCVEDKQALSSPKVLLAILSGAQVFALTLSESMACKRPELFVRLTLLHRADGSLQVVASSGLGAEVTATLRVAEDPLDSSKRATCDRLYEVFSNQYRDDWSAVYNTIKGLAAATGGDSFSTSLLPTCLDFGSKINVEIAGRLAYLLTRGRDQGMRCSLTKAGEAAIQLSALSLDLGAAVEVEIDEAEVVQVRFLHQSQKGGLGSARWSELGVVRRKPSCVRREVLAEIVSCLRTFFRDPNGAEATVHASPAATVFREVVGRLAHEGFVRVA